MVGGGRLTKTNISFSQIFINRDLVNEICINVMSEVKFVSSLNESF